MKVNTSMPTSLVPFFEKELQLAKSNLSEKNLETAWHHYERAHILSQKYPYQHTLVHWQMFKFGIQIKDAKEVLGQIPRLIFGGVKSFVGQVPVGNTGGANVPPLRKMEIPEDLKKILDENP